MARNQPLKENFKRLRAIQWLKEKAVSGLTMREIGDKYGVSERTVQRALTWAEKANLFVEIEDQLIREIAPLAAERIKNILVASDDDETAAKVALEVMKGLNIIKKDHPITSKDAKDRDNLVVYIQQKREQALIESNTIDIEPGEDGFYPIGPQLQLVGRVATDTAVPEGGIESPAVHAGDDSGYEPQTSTSGSPDSGENRVSGPQEPAVRLKDAPEAVEGDSSTEIKV